MKFTLALGFCPTGHYLPLARAADACGWDAITVPDGLFYYQTTSTAYPYSEDGLRFWQPDTPFLDPFDIIAAMSAVTERIHFYPGVLKLAVRNPLLVAKSLGTCAALSNERVALGVGLSPWPEDFTVLGQEWSNRGPRSAEMIEIIRGLLRGDMFEYHGNYYDVPPMQIAPVPVRPVPIYIGGLAEPALKRAARMADGYFGWESAQCSFDDFRGVIARLHAYREEYQRADEPFEIKMLPARLDAGRISMLEDFGVTDLVCAPWFYYGTDPDDLAAKRDAVTRFADEVIAKRS